MIVSDFRSKPKYNQTIMWHLFFLYLLMIYIDSRDCLLTKTQLLYSGKIHTSGMGSCIHWYSNCIRLEFSTRWLMCPSSPSASPLNKSNATIMKSLSGASNCSGLWLFACTYTYKYTIVQIIKIIVHKDCLIVF